MKVKAIWEFDADVSHISPEHVNVAGVAVDMAREELAWLLLQRELTHEDFEYVAMRDEKEASNDHT